MTSELVYQPVLERVTEALLGLWVVMGEIIAKPGIVAHTFNPSTWSRQAESSNIKDSLVLLRKFRIARATQRSTILKNQSTCPAHHHKSDRSKREAEKREGRALLIHANMGICPFPGPREGACPHFPAVPEEHVC